MLPQYELLFQCIDIVKVLPIDCWESQTRPQKRAAGLVARWAIEKAFESFFVATGRDLPKDRSIVSLFKESGLNPSSEQFLTLPMVDRYVTATEPDESDDMGIYLDCCWLARGIVTAVMERITLSDIITRMQCRQDHS
jgi:hypothetical protein